MKKRANPKCPVCGSKKTIKKGSRRGLKRYQCKENKHWFSINHKQKQEPLWVQYIDATPYRKLADQKQLSVGETFRRVQDELNNLLDNTYLTAKYCNRWSGILVVDGKHVKVKGYKKKIPFLYGIDFLRHDFPVGLLAPSESEAAFKKYFGLIKRCDYPLKIVVCDDVVSALKPGLLYHYPKALIQLCHTHFLENIRKQLNIRTDTTYHHFFNSLVKHVFCDPTNHQERLNGLHHVLLNRTNNDPVLQAIVMYVHERLDELFAYEKISHCPKTTNSMECFNSHLQGRLKAIKGFQSFQDANRFLNGYLIRRRMKRFTDCNEPFKHFNGKMPLENTIKKTAEWPEIPGIQAPNNER